MEGVVPHPSNVARLDRLPDLGSALTLSFDRSTGTVFPIPQGGAQVGVSGLDAVWVLARRPRTRRFSFVATTNPVGSPQGFRLVQKRNLGAILILGPLETRMASSFRFSACAKATGRIQPTVLPPTSGPCRFLGSPCLPRQGSLTAPPIRTRDDENASQLPKPSLKRGLFGGFRAKLIRRRCHRR